MRPVVVISVVSSISIENILDNNLELFQNVPNPTSDITSISFYVAQSEKIRLTILNSLGQEIQILANSNFDIGTHTIEFNSTGLPSGSYLYKLETNNNSLTKQLTILN